jgi:hypothetical protein
MIPRIHEPRHAGLRIQARYRPDEWWVPNGDDCSFVSENTNCLYDHPFYATIYFLMMAGF